MPKNEPKREHSTSTQKKLNFAQKLPLPHEREAKNRISGHLLPVVGGITRFLFFVICDKYKRELFCRDWKFRKM